jgi:NAD(P)-dependent dehydrogenase (short-subunit alcohol dehydrogenase family)
MAGRLDGKTALITGTGGGQGRAAAELFCAEEASVVGCDLNTAETPGRRLAYTYEVAEFVPGERFVMRTAQGRFRMETTYTWEDAGDRATQMTLRNRGEPAGFAKLTAPMVAAAMRRANRKDLERLKAMLEPPVS